MRITSTAAATLLLVAGLAACSTAQPQDPTPQTTTTSAATYTGSQLPPQPTRTAGKYVDPQAMAAKLTANGVPFVASTSGGYMNEDHTDINGAGYLYGTIGKDSAALYTFDWPKIADDTEKQQRGQGIQTYRGDGWIVAAKNPATLATMIEALDK